MDESAELVIGTILPVTGDLAFLGPAEVAGAELAAAWFCRDWNPVSPTRKPRCAVPESPYLGRADRPARERLRRACEHLGGLGFDVRGVPGMEDFDAVEAPDGYFVQKPGLWPTGYSVKHRQQYNDMLKSSHIDNPWEVLTCNDCHSPHSGKGGPFQFTNDDSAGNEYVFGNNSRALMSNVRCLSCHATHGPFATLTLDDIAIYHTSRGGTVDKDGMALMPTPAEQTSAEDLVEQAVKAHSGQAAGMPLAPYVPEESVIPANYGFGEGPVGRCTACHMTKTAKSATWFDDVDGQRIEGDASSHFFDVVLPAAGTDQPNACGKCHAGFRTSSTPPGED